MARAKYIVKTEGNLTTIWRQGGKPGSGSTSNPTWEEIKHSFENLPDVAPKPKPKPQSKRRKKKR